MNGPGLSPPHVEAMTPPDWPAVEDIYRQGIATGNATFETEAPSWERWNANHVERCRLVARAPQGPILGWAALSRVSTRAVYAGVAEVSVYVAASAQGRGVGTELLKALVEESEKAGFWTLQASIFPENQQSLLIHERCGFRVVGTREKIACLGDTWRDTVLMERRSRIVRNEKGRRRAAFCLRKAGRFTCNRAA